MGELGLAAAFLGGALTLISPCSALLLPSFFAYAFAHPRELLARTVVFWLGLCLTLVPLGVGSALVSTLFYGHREVLIAVAGWAIIALGMAQLLGLGFGLPGADRLRERVATPGRARGWAGTFALGAVYGLAGFCSGPILGAVLTLAATDGGVVGGGVLLAVYALGMAAPMFVLALLWDRFDLGRRRWRRGRPVRIAGRELHTSQLISGVLFVVIGWLFLRFDGTAGITGVLGFGDTTDLEFEAQSWIAELSARDLDVWLLAAAGVVLLGVLALRVRRIRNRPPDSRPAGDTIGAHDRQESR